MKTHRSIAAALAALSVAAAAGAQDAPPPVRPPPAPPSGEAAPPPDAVKPSGEVSKEAFVTRLTPYGKWVETPEYGRVFVPNAQAQSADWRPYVAGRWVYTDWGWTWASEEPFGWATYHYGRWYNRVGLGWYWVPGRVWGPAWVSWRWNAGYIAWAPMGPRRYVWAANSPYWVAVHGNHFTSPVRTVVIAPRLSVGIVAQTRPLSGAYARQNRGFYGPPVDHVSRVTGQQIRPVAAHTVAPGAVNHAQSGFARANPNRVARPPGANKPAGVARPPGRAGGRGRRR